jgi:uncharacterized protein
MQNQYDPRTTGVNPTVSVGVPRAARDAGLRSYMLSVYNYMASGVLLTGIVALGLAMTGVAQSLWYGGGILRWVVIFAPLIMVDGRDAGLLLGFRGRDGRFDVRHSVGL